MITEDYVSFETAKLLKEKGYKGSFNGYYNNAGCAVDKPNFFLKAPEYQYYERISLQMAMKWLREIHCLTIDIFHYRDWKVTIKTIPNDYLKADYSNDELKPSETYEQACEAAIKYCLENLV